MKKVIFFLFIIYSSFVSAVTEDLVKVFARVVHGVKIDLKNGENIDAVLDNCSKYMRGQNDYGLDLQFARKPSTNMVAIYTTTDGHAYVCFGTITSESTSGNRFDIYSIKFKKKENNVTILEQSFLKNSQRICSTYNIDISCITSLESLESLESLRTENYIENNEHPSFTAAPDSSSSSSPASDSSVADFPVISSEQVMENGIQVFKSLMIYFRAIALTAGEGHWEYSEQECLNQAWNLVDKTQNGEGIGIYYVRGSRTEPNEKNPKGFFIITLKINRVTENNFYLRCSTKFVMDEANPRYTLHAQTGLGEKSIKHAKLQCTFNF